VSKLLDGRPPRAFDNVELVVASWTASPTSRGTIQLTTSADGVAEEWSDILQTPTSRQHGYDRYNLTPFFDKIRQRLSTGNHQYRFSSQKYTEWRKTLLFLRALWARPAA